MNTIPFNTRDMVRDRTRAMNAPKLADPVPPVEPPLPVLLAKPRRHDVVAWRHDGEVRKTAHDTKELALAAATALHWAVVYKWTVLCGREAIETRRLDPPAGMPEDVLNILFANSGL